MTTKTTSATSAAAAKIAKPKKNVSRAKQEQTALPLPTPALPEYGTLKTSSIIVREQVRKTFDDQSLNDLAADIATRGILQPLTVRKTTDGFVLVAGERRLRAAKIVPLDSVPVLIVDMDDNEHQLAQLAENIQREELTLEEEAEAMKTMLDALGDLGSVAARVHKSKSWVSKRISLAKGLGYWAGGLLTGGFTEDIELLQTVDKIERENSSNAAWAICEKIKAGTAGREEAREVLRRLKEDKETPKEPKKPKEKESAIYPEAERFTRWLKEPNPWETLYVDYAFRIMGEISAAVYDERVNKVLQLEKELANARSDRDSYLKATCKQVLESHGLIALDGLISEFQKDEK